LLQQLSTARQQYQILRSEFRHWVQFDRGALFQKITKVCETCDQLERSVLVGSSSVAGSGKFDINKTYY